MGALREVDVPVLPLDRFLPLVGEERYAQLQAIAKQMRSAVRGRTVWTLNSAANGGGVAEMLRVLVGYALGAGVPIRWQVISGDPEFFAVTKRVHNRVHGSPGDDGELGSGEAEHYAAVAADNAAALGPSVARGDIVLLHDPQTAGLARPLADLGAHVIWRCHIGADRPNRWTDEAWSFLLPHLEAAEALVFSRRSHVPAQLAGARLAIIPPSIDPFSPKNHDMSDEVVRHILGAAGIVGGETGQPATFTCFDGTEGHIRRRASLVSEGDTLDPTVPTVVQVSRWDRLKDMAGVMRGFADGVVGHCDAHLVLVGPAVDGVADDPEGAAVLEECVTGWRALSTAQRHAISLVTLPMEDIDENAAMVNAAQRHATVVVQKSLHEGFGLTVAEGMWKGKPVLASAVGGIVDQIAPGTGVLLEDPADLGAFATTLVSLLADPDRMARLGSAARRHVSDHFLGDRHLIQLAELMAPLLSE